MRALRFLERLDRFSSDFDSDEDIQLRNIRERSNYFESYENENKYYFHLQISHRNNQLLLSLHLFSQS